MKISKAIRRALAEKGWTQAEFAKKMHVHPPVVSRWVNMETMTLDRMIKASVILDMKLSEFVALGEG